MDRRYKKRIDRYWLQMEKQCDEALSNLDPNDWFDLWHTHPDWDGKGNAKPENRLRASELTFQFLTKAEALTEHRNDSVQCFAIIKNDTMNNSIYIHSENPNDSEYPFKYQGVSWDIHNDELEKIVNLKTHQIGVFKVRMSNHSSYERKPNKLINKDKKQLAVFVPQHFSQQFFAHY